MSGVTRTAWFIGAYDLDKLVKEAFPGLGVIMEYAADTECNDGQANVWEIGVVGDVDPQNAHPWELWGKYIIPALYALGYIPSVCTHVVVEVRD